MIEIAQYGMLSAMVWCGAVQYAYNRTVENL